ncbi:hypothetical protein PR048_008727 [Dryococelus australis]|uniref:Uncharacterized protein n=1 Tax=Dryococelus australis TaxID=614101 RepID=A0ABQ9HXZ0_9NEOP|nr:hypothetical protein PR048_008727 [Dryococelus australis]
MLGTPEPPYHATLEHPTHHLFISSTILPTTCHTPSLLTFGIERGTEPTGKAVSLCRILMAHLKSLHAACETSSNQLHRYLDKYQKKPPTLLLAALFSTWAMCPSAPEQHNFTFPVTRWQYHLVALRNYLRWPLVVTSYSPLNLEIQGEYPTHITPRRTSLGRIGLPGEGLSGMAKIHCSTHGMVARGMETNSRVDVLQTLIESMPDRVAAVIATRGVTKQDLGFWVVATSVSTTVTLLLSEAKILQTTANESLRTLLVFLEDVGFQNREVCARRRLVGIVPQKTGAVVYCKWCQEHGRQPD